MVVRTVGAHVLSTAGRQRITSPSLTVVLLAGGAGLQEFSQAIGRSVLDLPIGDAMTLWGHWWREIRGMVGEMRSDRVDVRIVGGEGKSRKDDRDEITVDQMEEPRELRGTGGILRDLTDGFPEDHYLLVASAATLLLEPLAPLVGELFAARSDVAFFVDEQDIAANLMLIRCGCLRGIPDVGFVDFKEQALPRIAAANVVTVLRRAEPIAASMRTAAEYVRALRAYHVRSRQRLQGLGISGGAFAEDWQPAFRIVEPAAQVSEAAGIHDSVVLGGGRVGAGAILVRSLVCPNAVVAGSSVVVDRVVEASGSRARSRHSNAHS